MTDEMIEINLLLLLLWHHFTDTQKDRILRCKKNECFTIRMIILTSNQTVLKRISRGQFVASG